MIKTVTNQFQHHFRKHLSGPIIFVSATLLFFQNCDGGFQAVDRPQRTTHAISKKIYDTGVTLKVANRFLLANTYVQLFLPDNTDLQNCPKLSNAVDKALCNKIRNKILLNSGLYAGNCDHGQGDICNQNTSSARSIASLNVAREAGRLNLCEEVLQQNRSVLHLVSRIPANHTNFEVGKVNDLISLFYPGYKPSSQMVEALAKVADKFDNQTDKWRFVALALCKSPGWQVY